MKCDSWSECHAHCVGLFACYMRPKKQTVKEKFYTECISVIVSLASSPLSKLSNEPNSKLINILL